jgi:hypothetical protein
MKCIKVELNHTKSLKDSLCDLRDLKLAVREMFPKVLRLAPSLLSCITSIHAYCSKSGA